MPPFARHQVILPVYTPETAGYFEQLPEILNLSLRSLRATSDPTHTVVTVIANGCHADVVHQLRSSQTAGLIDQLVINSRNFGKVDSLANVVRGSFAEVITMADADVLFLPCWQHESERILRAFPECGMVSPFPGIGIEWHATSATILNRRLRRESGIVPDQDLADFAQSIDRPQFSARSLVWCDFIGLIISALSACIQAPHAMLLGAKQATEMIILTGAVDFMSSWTALVFIGVCLIRIIATDGVLAALNPIALAKAT